MREPISTETYQTSGGGWIRRRDWADAPSDRIHLAGREDATSTFLGPYDARCSACWLGFGHSIAKHEGALS